MKKKLKSSQGLSRVEAICITCITIILVFFVFLAFQWYQRHQYMAEDAMMVNTAESVANLHLTDSACPVRNCAGGNCEHLQADGSYIGYFDHPLNTIAGTRPKGYNSYKEMTILDKTYRGKAGTMVIEVKVLDGEITCSWVKGS